MTTGPGRGRPLAYYLRRIPGSDRGLINAVTVPPWHRAAQSPPLGLRPFLFLNAIRPRSSNGRRRNRYPSPAWAEAPSLPLLTEIGQTGLNFTDGTQIVTWQ